MTAPLAATPPTTTDDAAPAPRLRVTRLTVSNFRNYVQARIEPIRHVVALIGPNGAGKTNVLEALACLSPGRGLRRAKLPEMTRRGASQGWAVAAQIRHDDGEARIGVGLARTAEGREKRAVRVEGENAGPAELGTFAPMLWLTPAMDRLFTEAPSGRRRFLDRLVFACRPEHARSAALYERAMRERQKLLNDGVRNDNWLSAIERRMAESGAALAVARMETIAHLRAYLPSPVADLPEGDCAVDGDLEAASAYAPAADVEDGFAARLAAGRRRDAEARRPLEGPHRSDLRMRHLGKDMPAEHCSTGEQKALLLSLVLAQARLVRAERGGPAPLLLLDEVAAHLDENRRAAVFQALIDLGAQLWMTGTEATLFEALGDAAHYVHVRDGAFL